MQGKILAFDFRSGEGHIAGNDGNRYTFAVQQWRAEKQPAVGQQIDFNITDEGVKDIFLLSSHSVSGDKNRITAALLAFFLGGFGAHKFYLGKTTAGVIMLIGVLVGWILLFIPPIIIGVIAFIEFIIYLTKSDEDFQREYVDGDKAWF